MGDDFNRLNVSTEENASFISQSNYWLIIDIMVRVFTNGLERQGPILCVCVCVCVCVYIYIYT